MSKGIEDIIKQIKKPLDFHLAYKGVVPKRQRLPALGLMTYHPADNYLIETGNVHFYARVTISALIERKIPYEILTVDNVTDIDSFNPNNYPVVVLPLVRDTYWKSYRRKNDCVESMLNYLRNGGTLISIGGKPFSRALDYNNGFWLNMDEQKNELEKYTSSFLENHLLPVSELETATLVVVDETKDILKGIEAKICLRKNVGYIWDYLLYPMSFHRDVKKQAKNFGKIIPLLNLVTKPHRKEILSSAIIEYNHGGRFIYLPQYFLVPTIFSGKTTMERSKGALFNPVMDTIPAMILEKLIRYFWKKPNLYDRLIK